MHGKGKEAPRSSRNTVFAPFIAVPDATERQGGCSQKQNVFCHELHAAWRWLQFAAMHKAGNMSGTNIKKGAGAFVSVLFPVQAMPAVGHGHSPKGGFCFPAVRPQAQAPNRAACRTAVTRQEDRMDKDRKEALQVAKELTAKFIETRTVSPGNFAEVFPSVYRVVCTAIGVDADQDNKGK